jgi:PTH2 family peptidyl-tRNA hydrolase
MGFRSFLHRLTAPPPASPPSGKDMKLVCVVNQSLSMGKGKIAAQVGHACVESFLRAGASHPSHVEAWLANGQKKICLKVPDEGHFKPLIQAASKVGAPHHVVRDAGHTQIPSGSKTVLAIGPFDEATLDSITGELKLL